MISILHITTNNKKKIEKPPKQQNSSNKSNHTKLTTSFKVQGQTPRTNQATINT
jgi:hypothetical protein